jgi:hypothetical protein
MILNPEFHRYLWLNFSPFKLMAMPALLILLFTIFSNTGLQNWQAGLMMPSFYLFILIVLIWGNYEAASSSDSDKGNNTWDFQKMSPISAWSLLMGKLLGSTSYAWYAGALILIAFVFSFYYAIALPEYANIRETFPDPIMPVVCLILSALIGHAVSFYIGLSKLTTKKSSAGICSIVGMAVSLFALSSLLGFNLEGEFLKENKFFSWNGMEINTHIFLFLSLIYVLFWVTMGAQREIRAELQHRNSPFVYIIFILTLCFYLTGFLDASALNSSQNNVGFYIAKAYLSFLIFLPFLYFSMVFGANDLARYKRFLFACRQKDKSKIIVNCPSWLALIPFAIVCYITTEFYFLMIDDLNFNNTRKLVNFSGFLTTVSTSLFLFVIRDGLFWHFMLLGMPFRHAWFKIFLSYLMMYILLPLMIILYLPSEFKGIGLSIFYPPLSPLIEISWFSYVPLIIQIFLLGFLLKMKLQNLQKAANSLI